MNQLEKLETSVFNMVSLVNVLDNKSREKNILINNVREQQFENSGQLITIVKKIVKNINKNVTVTRAYKTGGQSGNLQKNRQIIASVLDKQKRFSIVWQAQKHKPLTIKTSTSLKTCTRNRTRQAQLPLYNEKRQEYRNVYFRGKMLVFHNRINQGESSFTYSQCSPIASRPGAGCRKLFAAP